ncbi:MAG: SDR family NAD(P)-dependent oxidoreductase [Limimaricola sp.]|uniref:SDR family oxidoreductase n=1 Tax=Limimaricola sp. TaxID=2211665 RepID=UPI001D383459|nr:SDR family oxidoreductase [Limimaricola sp.]MBI1417016.1 SDR family NAD(P)-dependent oxidoreductase [Limimaricola sp.]
MGLQGQVIAVTGANRGIGEAAVRAFAAAGARVALLARDGAAAERIAGEIGPEALAVTCDVADAGQVAAAVTQIVDRFGRLDVFVANAGVIGPMGPLEEADISAWSATIDINLKGVFHCLHAAAPQMLAQGGGTFITISSGAAHNALGGWSAYCASKAGAYMLTRTADAEFRARGLRVMGLSPGTVATDMQRAIKASGVGPVARLDWSDHIPPDWPAKALIWMCGPEADGYLGQDVSLREPAIRHAVGLA